MKIRYTIRGVKYLPTKTELKIAKRLTTQQGLFLEGLRLDAIKRNDIIYTDAYIKKIQTED